MLIFCRIVELGAFATVAREMNLSAMMISKYMAQLEESLGALLNRITRQLSMTEAGKIYNHRSKQLLDDFSELEEYTRIEVTHLRLAETLVLMQVED